MFKNRITSSEIIKCANGWLLIVPESFNKSPFQHISDVYRDPEIIQSLKDLTREISDDDDPIMAEIRRSNAENKPATVKNELPLLKDMPEQNMFIFKTMNELTAFLKIHSGE